MKNSDKTDGEDKRVVEEVKEEKVESEVQPTPVNKKEKEKKVVKINKSGLNWYGVGVTILFVLPLIVTGIIYATDYFYPEAAKARVIRERVLRCYEAANPSKVGEIDQFIGKYKGKEHLLFAQLRNKYGMKHSQCDVLR